MIEFYDLIDEDFSYYSRNYLSQLSESINFDDNILTESSQSFIDKIINKLKAFFRKIKEFFKKWWNKVLKFLCIDKKEPEIKEVKVVDDADSITSKESKEIVEKIDKEIESLQTGKYIYYDTNKYADTHENELSDEEKQVLIKKFFNRDAKKFKTLEDNINSYIDARIRNSEILNKDGADFNNFRKSGRYLGLSFTRVFTIKDNIFNDKDKLNEFCKKVIFKTNGDYKFYKLDIGKLYTNITICDTYLNEILGVVYNIYLTLYNIKYYTLGKNNIDINEHMDSLEKLLATDIDYGRLVEDAMSDNLNAYIEEDISTNPMYIMSYLYKLLGIRILARDANKIVDYSMIDEISNMMTVISSHSEKLNNPDTLQRIEKIVTGIQSFYSSALSKATGIVNVFVKLEANIKVFAENNIKALIQNIDDIEDATPEERRNIWRKINNIDVN